MAVVEPNSTLDRGVRGWRRAGMRGAPSAVARPVPEGRDYRPILRAQGIAFGAATAFEHADAVFRWRLGGAEFASRETKAVAARATRSDPPARCFVGMRVAGCWAARDMDEKIHLR